MSGEPGGGITAVNSCTSSGWVRGLVELGRYRRLSDLLNNAAAPYLVLRDGQVLPFGAAQWPPAQPRLLLSKRDVLFLLPTDGDHPHPPLGLQIAKQIVPVDLYVGAYQLTGMLHRLEQMPWEQYLANLRDHFLPLTAVRIVHATTGDELAHVEYAAVNRDRITALYERA